MLYLIIPPILIVLSLVGIILFLMKKAPKAIRLNDARLAYDNSKAGENYTEKKTSRGKRINNKMLLVLEKITRKFKVFFLKLENLFTGWGESIREKRNSRSKAEKLSEKPAEQTDSRPEKNYLSRVYRREEKTQTQTFSRASERVSRPILSEKVAVPKSYAKKNIFENILIERIAVNPKDVEAYERLGEYYIEIENWDYAKECFKQVIRLNPENINVKAKMRKLERILAK